MATLKPFALTGKEEKALKDGAPEIIHKNGGFGFVFALRNGKVECIRVECAVEPKDVQFSVIGYHLPRQ